MSNTRETMLAPPQPIQKVIDYDNCIVEAHSFVQDIEENIEEGGFDILDEFLRKSQKIWDSTDDMNVKEAISIRTAEVFGNIASSAIFRGPDVHDKNRDHIRGYDGKQKAFLRRSIASASMSPVIKEWGTANPESSGGNIADVWLMAALM
jgi:hypothetical protein